MDRERLTTLADFLETVPEARFNINYWCNIDYFLGGGGCGFAGCALGWATQIPEFKNDGLIIVGRYRTELTPSYGGFTYPYEAAAKFFDISNYISGYLFSPTSYHVPKVTSLTVSHRIRDLLRILEILD